MHAAAALHRHPTLPGPVRPCRQIGDARLWSCSLSRDALILRSRRGSTAAVDLAALLHEFLPAGVPQPAALALQRCPLTAASLTCPRLGGVSELWLHHCRVPGEDWDSALRTLVEHCPHLARLEVFGAAMSAETRAWLATRVPSLGLWYGESAHEGSDDETLPPSLAAAAALEWACWRRKRFAQRRQPALCP